MEVYEKKIPKRILVFGVFAVAVLIAAFVLLALGSWQWSIVLALSGISFILLTIGLLTKPQEKCERYLNLGVLFWILTIIAAITFCMLGL